MTASAQAELSAPIAELIAQPLRLPNGQLVKNRLLKSAMSEGLAGPGNQVPETMPTLYERWAQGGIGLSVTGNVMIDRRALGEPGNVALEDERDLPLLQRWAQAGKSDGGLIYMQLNHPGRQCPKGLNRESVAPSAVPFSEKMRPFFATPRELLDHEIEDLIQRFARSAAIAEKAGFDGVQIHGAHGYLVSQFLSPLTNHRSDAWGGDELRRRRFVTELYRAIRSSTSKGFGVSIKINSADFQRGGITPEASTETILALAAEGMDFIEVSGGSYEAPAMVSPKKSTREREAYFLEFAETLRAQMDRPLALTGGFRSGRAMAQALDSGAVDLVGLARTLAVQPDFPRALTTRGDVRVDLRPQRVGIKLVDDKAMLEVVWYERQIQRMGRGRDPNPDESAWKSLVAYGLANGPKAFRARRAR